MTFKISKLLSPFIAFDDVASFCRSLRTAEGLISGSVALQFFDRQTFDRLASLDIYVQYQKSDIVDAWLQSHGAIGVPQDRGDTDVAADLHITSEIWTVLKFNVPDSSRIIRLILTRQNPLIAVLCFHSSMFLGVHLLIFHEACVMNFISYDAAYSLYPLSMFHDQRSILWGTLSARERAAACRYQKVGWVVCGVLDAMEMACRPQELGSEIRCVGDFMRWRFHLDSGEHCDAWTFGGKVCSWSLIYLRTRAGLSGQRESEHLFKFNMLLICEGD